MTDAGAGSRGSPAAHCSLPRGGFPGSGSPAGFDIVVEPLRRADAPRCAQLERVLFADDDPWTERAFLDELAAGAHYLAARATGGVRAASASRAGRASAVSPAGRPAAHGDERRGPEGAREGLVSGAGVWAVDVADAPRGPGELVGYGGIALVAGPPQAEAEIHTIGVDPEHQRRGIGRLLLRALLAVADAEHARVFLEVRTDNDAARALYEAEGFTVVGLRRCYYRPSGADAFSMRRQSR